MPAYTGRLNMYLPGGGSNSIGGDDEVADIDKINQNLQKLDESVGVNSYSTFPSNPFPGQMVRVGGGVYSWDVSVAQWRQMAPYVGSTPPSSPLEGYLWVDTN